MSLSHDIEKGLILIYASSNHQMRVNWTIDNEKTVVFTRNEANKKELISVLRTLAAEIESDYPDKGQNGVCDKCLNILKRH